MAKKKEASQLRVTLVKSTIRYSTKQKLTVKSLGLRRLHSSVVVSDTPEVRGMIDKVSHLVSVEEA
ncbi:50S ribosomal protein L30 [Anaerolineales bacterium]|jgi:large subunit ribosomal protein L30